MVVKLPVLIDATRQVALAYRFYEKEVAFYNELAAETTLRTPEVYFSAHDLDTDNFVLVMQDLGHLRAADQVAGCEREDAVAAVAALARHHAAFWNDTRFHRATTLRGSRSRPTIRPRKESGRPSRRAGSRSSSSSATISAPTSRPWATGSLTPLATC